MTDGSSEFGSLRACESTGAASVAMSTRSCGEDPVLASSDRLAVSSSVAAGGTAVTCSCESGSPL
jgi:hypothetical protein